ncbi:hypothetical protein ABWH92_01995 [Ahrensia marina]|uniref:hypothetical protein n=1 Tax=Ahrensia marina TaxID=1514904 RepID=UPI0035D0F6FF
MKKHWKKPRDFPMVQGADGLMRWTAGYMKRVRSPKSARDVTEAWYSSWRGKEDKPARVKKMYKRGNVNRVAGWMKRQHANGNLELVDRGGFGGAKRYRLIDGKLLTKVKPTPRL